MEGKQMLIIGGGQLGTAFSKRFPDATLLDFPQIDLTDEDSIRKNLENLAGKVKVVVNTAAWTDVDGAEDPANFEKVEAINATGVGILARISEKLGMTLVHFSSDYVFDGEQQNHREDEAFAPLNRYGQSKARGDLLVERDNPKHYILRTSWLIGDNFPLDSSTNFVKTISKLILEKESIRVVNDQFGRLTFTSDLVAATEHLLENDAPFGTYNFSNDSMVIESWFYVAKSIQQRLISLGEESARDCFIVPQTTEESLRNSPKKFIARRPKNSDFNLMKIELTGFEVSWSSLRLSEYLKGLQMAGYFENSKNKGEK